MKYITATIFALCVSYGGFYYITEIAGKSFSEKIDKNNEKMLLELKANAEKRKSQETGKQ